MKLLLFVWFPNCVDHCECLYWFDASMFLLVFFLLQSKWTCLRVPYFLREKVSFLTRILSFLVRYVCYNTLLLFMLSEELINEDKEKYNLTTTTKTKSNLLIRDTQLTKRLTNERTRYARIYISFSSIIKMDGFTKRRKNEWTRYARIYISFSSIIEMEGFTKRRTNEWTGYARIYISFSSIIEMEGFEIFLTYYKRRYLF